MCVCARAERQRCVFLSFIFKVNEFQGNRKGEAFRFMRELIIKMLLYLSGRSLFFVKLYTFLFGLLNCLCRSK